MALSVLAAFAKFLSNHGYSTTMWENGYGSKEVNDVCHELTVWAQTELSLEGEFLVLWSRLEGAEFRGDSELVYVVDEDAYLIPNPFIERDSEGFVVSLQKIQLGRHSDLYSVRIQTHILYNAV